MKMLKQIYLPLIFQTRQCSAKPQLKFKPTVILDENTNELIKQDALKPRKHPGVIHRATIQLPKWIINAMYQMVQDHPRNTISKDAMNLHRHLNAKLPPPEKEMVESKYVEMRKLVEQKMDYERTMVSDDKNILPEIHGKALRVLRRNIRPWAPIQYDKYRGLMYMLARGGQDYAILYKIMKEIQSRDPEFRPKTLLDFGSGIGTVSWVVSEFWKSSLKERMCIDISTEINEIAEELIKYADPKIKSAAFYRQYLPISSVPTFDIVVSSFSLLELPNRKMRIDTLSTLWKKTEKYLVLVEFGTKGGFQVISEARDFLLHLINVQKERDSKYDGFILSPCPHDDVCPKRAIDDDSVCKFQAEYFQISFGKQLIPRSERYSYVVFKKGGRRENLDLWPRIVEPVIVRSCHSICRMCTAEGKLQEIIFSKAKHQRPTYNCARSSRWGDRLPIEIGKSKEE